MMQYIGEMSSGHYERCFPSQRHKQQATTFCPNQIQTGHSYSVICSMGYTLIKDYTGIHFPPVIQSIQEHA
jgi:hypothetical protein